MSHAETLLGPPRPRSGKAAHVAHGGVPGYLVVRVVQSVGSRSSQLGPIHAAQDVEEGTEAMEAGVRKLAGLLDSIDTFR